jgi:hypothetical protein
VAGCDSGQLSDRWLSCRPGRGWSRFRERRSGRGSHRGPHTFDAWLAWPGIAIGLALVVSSFEFVGPFEVKGWKLAGRIVPIAYIAWSLWLVISGLVLLIHDLNSPIG